MTKLDAVFTIIVIGWLVSIGMWLANGYKLTKCDFEAPYKCEVIHTIGLVPPAQVVTVWFDTDEGG